MYAVAPGFWVDFLLIVGGLVLILFIFNLVMTRVLKVERKFFSNTYVTEKHKKIDWYIRMAGIILLIGGFIININRYGRDALWFLEPWFLILVLGIMTGSLRAHMEWKHEENRNNYKFTVLQLVFIMIVLATLYFTNFFGRI